MPDTIDLDGLSIDSITPATPDALSEIVRVAHTTSKPLYWVGGGTSLDAGLPPRKAGTAVRTTLLDKVIDYPARDMTITVQSGIRISTLQEILAKEKQTLPLDIPWPDKATLGGVLACTWNPPRFRDWSDSAQRSGQTDQIGRPGCEECRRVRHGQAPCGRLGNPWAHCASHT